ncbi:aspartate-semialdehyde dehydrogenase [Aureococcus anophagefferens]|nr:aspartate-semialdehyde dehydrogenase [Aureococcus anophagefferens]
MVSFMKKVLLALALALPIADAFQSLSGRALASPRRSLSRPYRSAGVRVVSATVMAAGGAPLKTVATANWGDITTEKFSVDAVTGFDVVFLAASGDFAEEYADAIGSVLAEGGVVVDNSSALRYKDGVPLVVPEVNGDQCEGASVIANPNCTTAIALMALYPLFKEFGLKKVIVSTYQAASGAGAAGMAELRDGVAMASTEGEKYVDSMGRFKEKANGYTKEEMKVTWECRKILGFPPIPDAAADAKLDTAPPKVSCTAVRIPTLRAHSEAITIETVKPVTPEAARKALTGFPGLAIADDTDAGLYPMPITSTGNYDVEVGRIRQNDVFGDRGLDFFICGDQLLRGAALNAVLIAENPDVTTDSYRAT